MSHGVMSSPPGVKELPRLIPHRAPALPKAEVLGEIYVPRFGRSPLERVLSKVVIADPGGCWIWTGTTIDGYGRLTLTEDGARFRVLTHRLVYERLVGPIPEGMQPDHLCRNRACCNPRHLDIVTPQENNLRGMGAAARNALKTHCPQNHEYTDENTIVLQRPNGRTARKCRTCARDRS